MEINNPNLSYPEAVYPPASQPSLERKPDRRSLLRRGILAREEENEEKHIEIDAHRKKTSRPQCPDTWKIYCYLVTCLFPPFILRLIVLGKKDASSQLAFREKMGLVSIIMCIMGFVGFLTFGFTQVVCPRPPISHRIDSIGQGYVVIRGWAYFLASWNDHPPVPDLGTEPMNPIYPPVNADGMDASFLFQMQNDNRYCEHIITPKTGGSVGQGSLPTYFPCRLFDPHSLEVPDSSTYSNHSGCHLTPTARSAFSSMKTLGVHSNNNKYDKAGRVYYEWKDINRTSHLAVYNSHILNLNLLNALPLSLFNVPVGGLIDTILKDNTLYGGQDITHKIASYRMPGMDWTSEANCLLDLIKVGEIDTQSVGCITSDVVLYTSLIVILGVILVKFGLAVLFGWCLSWKLGNFKEGRSYKERMKREMEIEHWTSGIHRPAEAIRPPSPYTNTYSRSKTKWMPSTSRFTQPETGSMHFSPLDRSGNSIWKQASSISRHVPYGSNVPDQWRPVYSNTSQNSSSQHHSPTSASRCSSVVSSNVAQSTFSTVSPFIISPNAIPQPKKDYMPFGFTLAHTMCLVTCYSEGVDGLRTTLDSIATTDFPNSHKLIVVIADGIIKGHGNTLSTPDICIGMMEDFIIAPEDVQPYAYVAIADGTKRYNQAKVYSGYYSYDSSTVNPDKQQRVPMITIVKCGGPEESGENKPGNRGKRDSQVILMSFLQKVMFDERMTMLEYEIFKMIWRATGVSPNHYEIVLMVDADTKVYPDALSRLVSCMVNDPEIMGLCGETKIGNKTDSWVSMIQVFEYYISHHQSKAFESMFGNVTCLPGCFCMYRIKAPKGNNGYWVPILANPDIIEHYSENVVDTLHKKNLLLLGEDRYLSTLMLRTFPRRKMLFVPQAVCKTVVPDSFRVLLSQRRRWINSTIHNLMELVFVRNLCGTFCFSMQFVVFMELVGTLALPAAISFTLYLIILAIIGQPAVLSLILLALILGLPAVLIVMTSRKLVYVGWMMIYLVSLPIWNFVLPTYAYWHFDDFSWGETRKVENEGKENHGDKQGEFDSSKIVMKKWHAYAYEEKRQEMVDRAHFARNIAVRSLSLGDVPVPTITPLPVSTITPLPAMAAAINMPAVESQESLTDPLPPSPLYIPLPPPSIHTLECERGQGEPKEDFEEIEIQSIDLPVPVAAKESDDWEAGVLKMFGDVYQPMPSSSRHDEKE
ncbi:chitin synthase-domain-containing protein [Spinellus fusiger]|nr:chitin synthase-domain-containing protein [Spinellus fusiger]